MGRTNPCSMGYRGLTANQGGVGRPLPTYLSIYPDTYLPTTYQPPRHSPPTHPCMHRKHVTYRTKLSRHIIRDGPDHTRTKNGDLSHGRVSDTWQRPKIWYPAQIGLSQYRTLGRLKLHPGVITSAGALSRQVARAGTGARMANRTA